MDGRSFGEHRCRLLAEAMLQQSSLVKRFEQEGLSLERPWLNSGSRDLEGPWVPGPGLAKDPLDRHLLRQPSEGLSLERPWLNSGSRDLEWLWVPGPGLAKDPLDRALLQQHSEGLSFERPWLNAGSRDLEWPLTIAAGPRSTQGGFIDTAARIGARLCRDAIWHEDRCTWTTDANRDDEVRHVAMGPDLYEGTSGVALFMTRLAKASGDRMFDETAQGAILHARRAKMDSANLYSGEAGVLLASAEVLGEEIDDAALLRSAEAFAFRAYDLMGGEAGVIIPLLHAWRKSRNPALLASAVRKGDWLIAEAEREEDRLSWASSGDVESPNLTGLSHGAAGVGWALAELFGCSGERRFADAALDAFRYEREYFDEDEQNWPDFRDDEVTFSAAWCHGAPGIALSRFRALRWIPDCGNADLRIALETTRRAVYDNWCLCHGQCGNAEILRIAGMRDAALGIAEEGVERFDRRRMPWPCWAVPDGPELPGLMTGLAGIGEFYLRMAGETISPSPLLFIG